MAKIPNFDEDLNIIAGLGDTPGSDNGLSTAALKAKFDAAGLAIQSFINTYIVPTINNYVASNDGFLKTAGDTMKGILSMGGNRITNVASPVNGNDAVNKTYADKMLPLSGGEMKGILKVLTPTDGAHAANKQYVDDKHTSAQVRLSSSGWSKSAPYTQTAALEGIQAKDEPHWDVVFSSNTDTAISEKEAFAMVDDLDTADGSVTFTCLEDKPEVDLTIHLEVNR